MKLLDYTKYLLDCSKYYFAKFNFNNTADILFNNQNHHSPAQRIELLADMGEQSKNASGLAVKLGIITSGEKIDFIGELCRRAKKKYASS